MESSSVPQFPLLLTAYIIMAHLLVNPNTDTVLQIKAQSLVTFPSFSIMSYPGIPSTPPHYF